MIDNIEIEYLRMALTRARKELKEPIKEKSFVAVA